MNNILKKYQAGGFSVEFPCAVIGMPDHVYRAYPALSCSEFKNFCPETHGSPSTYQAMREADFSKPEDETDLEIGTEVHRSSLEKLKPLFDSDCFQGTAKTAKKNVAIVKNCCESLKFNQSFQDLLDGAYTEISLFAVHSETGMKLKGRLDILKPKICNSFVIGDLKTIKKDWKYGLEKSIQNACESYGWWLQAAYYLQLVELVFGKPTEETTEESGKTMTSENYFKFYTVEKGGNFRVTLVDLSPSYLIAGQEVISKRLKQLADYQKLRVYPPEQITIIPPAGR